MVRIALFLLFVCLLPAALWAQPELVPMERDITQGALRVQQKDGGIVECPLKHTDVQASISGFIARVKVTQTFVNPSDEPIEAVYVFPLSHTGAVDDMTMVIGDRRIVGVIKRRAEARALYEAALRQGYTASLLEQERPNIFTRSVGNIKPRQEVKIEISYLDVLEYDMGVYEFHFPMVVGPRYNADAPFAGTPTPAANGLGANGAMPAKGVNPPVLKPGFRTGHDISLKLTMEAGVPVRDLKIVNHKATVRRTGATAAEVELDPADSVPNKDFVLRYAVAGEQPTMALLPYSESGSGGYFMLMIQPALDREMEKAPPRELVFLIDISGSMSGAPTAQVKRTLQEFFKRSKPDDTLQVITFAGSADKLFEKPVPATPENVNRALNYTDGYQAGGGTEMLKGIRMVLDEPPDPERARIVVLLTDGYIGNEAQIIEAVGKHAGERLRFWAIGIGSSPNRFLIDGVAKQGGGMGKVLDLNADPSELVGEIVSRIHKAQLADISIDWNGLDVCDTFPRRIPELWAGRPVVVFGRYYVGGQAQITVHGIAEGKPVSFPLAVNLPMQAKPEHAVLSKVWARRKIEDLSQQMHYGSDPAIIEEITNVALDYKLMSQYTSFVAIDESEQVDAPAKLPRRVGVPVPLPEGVSFEGIFGPAAAGEKLELADAFMGRPAQPLPIFGAVMPAEPALRGPAGPVGPAGPTGAYGPPGMVPPPAASMADPRAKLPMRTSITAGRAFPTPPTTNGPRMSSLDVGGVSASTKKEAMWQLGYAGTAGGDALRADIARRQQAAQEAIKSAQQSAEKKDWTGTVLQAQYAYLLGASYGDRNQQAQALGLIEQARQEQQKAWGTARPALRQKLMLVLRDRSIEEALAAVGQAAGLEFNVLAAGLADAAALNGGLEPRVTYLDLRGATVLQALEWILTPARLEYRVEPGRIVVGSARLLEGKSAWVYDVMDLALPLDKPEKPEEQAAQLQKELERFRAAIQSALGQEAKVDWFSPGLLLVYGEAKVHEQVSFLLAQLRSAEAKLTSQELKDLHQAALKRWAARADAREKRLAARRQAQALQTMAEFSLPLYSAALHGKVDDEALTELHIAWQEEATVKDILQGPHAGVAARSAWALANAAALMPKDESLANLANNALLALDGQFIALLNAARERPADARAQLGLCYATLAARQIPKARISSARLHAQEATALLAAGGQQDARLSVLRHVAAALLAPSPEVDKALFDDIAERKIAGDDALLLAAFAVKARGGELPSAFRRALPDLTAGQRLDGSTVVLINRLLAR